MNDTEISSETRALAKRADLDLPERYLAELASAWSHVEKMIKRLRRDRPYADEPAHIFNIAAIAHHEDAQDHD